MKIYSHSEKMSLYFHLAHVYWSRNVLGVGKVVVSK